MKGRRGLYPPGACLSVKRIVVVDDEPHVRNVLALKLQAAGYHVTLCRDGAEGLEEISATIPDLVFTDLQMPEMTGLEMAQALHANPQTCHIPLIMITSRGDILPEDHAANTNIRRLLDKPFSPRQILSMAAEILRSPDGLVTTAA